jgi:hypothetical protein
MKVRSSLKSLKRKLSACACRKCIWCVDLRFRARCRGGDLCAARIGVWPVSTVSSDS